MIVLNTVENYNVKLQDYRRFISSTYFKMILPTVSMEAFLFYCFQRSRLPSLEMIGSFMASRVSSLSSRLLESTSAIRESDPPAFFPGIDLLGAKTRLDTLMNSGSFLHKSPNLVSVIQEVSSLTSKQGYSLGSTSSVVLNNPTSQLSGGAGEKETKTVLDHQLLDSLVTKLFILTGLDTAQVMLRGTGLDSDVANLLRKNSSFTDMNLATKEKVSQLIAEYVFGDREQERRSALHGLAVIGRKIEQHGVVTSRIFARVALECLLVEGVFANSPITAVAIVDEAMGFRETFSKKAVKLKEMLGTQFEKFSRTLSLIDADLPGKRDRESTITGPVVLADAQRSGLIGGGTDSIRLNEADATVQEGDTAVRVNCEQAEVDGGGFGNRIIDNSAHTINDKSAGVNDYQTYVVNQNFVSKQHAAEVELGGHATKLKRAYEANVDFANQQKDALVTGGEVALREHKGPSDTLRTVTASSSLGGYEPNEMTAEKGFKVTDNEALEEAKRVIAKPAEADLPLTGGKGDGEKTLVMGEYNATKQPLDNVRQSVNVMADKRLGLDSSVTETINSLGSIDNEAILENVSATRLDTTDTMNVVAFNFKAAYDSIEITEDSLAQYNNRNGVDMLSMAADSPNDGNTHAGDTAFAEPVANTGKSNDYAPSGEGGSARGNTVESKSANIIESTAEQGTASFTEIVKNLTDDVNSIIGDRGKSQSIVAQYVEALKKTRTSVRETLEYSTTELKKVFFSELDTWSRAIKDTSLDDLDTGMGLLFLDRDLLTDEGLEDGGGYGVPTHYNPDDPFNEYYPWVEELSSLPLVQSEWIPFGSGEWEKDSNSGFLTCKSSNSAVNGMYRNDLTHSSYRFHTEFVVGAESATGTVGIVFKYTDSLNYYYFGLGPSGTRVMQMYRVQGGVEEFVGNPMNSFEWVLGKRHFVDLNIQDRRVQIWVDNRLQYDIAV